MSSAHGGATGTKCTESSRGGLSLPAMKRSALPALWALAGRLGLSAGVILATGHGVAIGFG